MKSFRLVLEVKVKPICKPDARSTEKAIVSVKGGENVDVAMICDLAHVVKREKAQIGIFVTLADPTKPVLTEAIKEGFYETLYGKFPRLQILTVEELLEGKKPQIPWEDPAAFKKAAREEKGCGAGSAAVLIATRSAQDRYTNLLRNSRLSHFDRGRKSRTCARLARTR